MKRIEFKFYVLNYDYNSNKVINYNIFNNIRLQEATEKTVRKYCRAPSKFKSRRDETTFTGFEAFCWELERDIMWQEWGRFQYEIAVGSIVDEKGDSLEKWDCYGQCQPNIEIIAREVIFQYKKWRKENKSGEN